MAEWTGREFSVGTALVAVMAVSIFEVSRAGMVCTCTDEEEVNEKLEAAERDMCSPFAFTSLQGGTLRIVLSSLTIMRNFEPGTQSALWIHSTQLSLFIRHQ